MEVAVVGAIDHLATMGSTTSRRSFLTGTLVGGAGGVLAMAGVQAVTKEDEFAHPEHSSVDIGFCTDMSAHHIQALELCERVLGQDTGGAVQSAATEVIRNQSIEVGMMRAWLADWGASTAPPTTVMAWMDMTDNQHMGGVELADMPGYATPDQLSSLALAEGTDKGRLWLQLMRAHHIGGVAMAEAATGLATEEKVVRLATTQAEVQSFEISQYDLLLTTTYA